VPPIGKPLFQPGSPLIRPDLLNAKGYFGNRCGRQGKRGVVPEKPGDAPNSAPWR
jgi:hypothetical protein